MTQGKLFLRQEQLLAIHGAFVESLQLHLITFSSSAGPGSKMYLLAQNFRYSFSIPIVLLRNQFVFYFSI